MKESTAREKVLKNVRNALINKLENPYPDIDFDKSVYSDKNEPLDITFAEEFTNVAGKFVFCENEKDFKSQLKLLFEEKKWKSVFCLDNTISDLLSENDIVFESSDDKFINMEAGITRCEYLVARLGSIMISSKTMSGRRLNFYPETHIVLAYTSQLVPDIKHALKAVKLKYEQKFPSMITFISGPSRTADIEKTLVMGAHGPKDVYVFLVDDGSQI